MRMSIQTQFRIIQSHYFSIYLKIYTEWANYYLERKSKRKIVDLSEDIRDGILLAELIEVVTSYKVNELTKKPKTTKQMVSKKS